MSTSSRRRKPASPVCRFRDVKRTRCGKGTDEARWTRDLRRVTCPVCKSKEEGDDD